MIHLLSGSFSAPWTKSSCADAVAMDGTPMTRSSQCSNTGMPVQGVLARQQIRWSCVAAARPRTARPPWRLPCLRNLSASSGRLGVVQGVQCALEKISLKCRVLQQTTQQRHPPKSSVSMSDTEMLNKKPRRPLCRESSATSSDCKFFSRQRRKTGHSCCVRVPRPYHQKHTT